MSAGELDSTSGPSRFEGTYRLHLQHIKGYQVSASFLFGLLFNTENEEVCSLETLDYFGNESRFTHR
jgi:hypothetical protein